MVSKTETAFLVSILYKIEISDLIVKPSFEGSPVDISRFTVRVGTFITLVEKGLKTANPGDMVLRLNLPNRRLTPTSPWIIREQELTVAATINKTTRRLIKIIFIA